MSTSVEGDYRYFYATALGQLRAAIGTSSITAVRASVEGTAIMELRILDRLAGVGKFGTTAILVNLRAA